MQIYQFLKLAQAINDNENVNKIILANLLDKDLAWLYANFKNTDYQQDFLDRYLNLVAMYADGRPLAYIFGHVFFHDHKILVDQNVLIPRNETEILVDRTLFYAEKLFNSQALDVLDLCTGSGCIAVSLALAKANWNFIASDISDKALAVAKANQNLYQLKNIKLVQSDLFASIKNKFNIIICNPPYIDQNSATYQISNLIYEPELALFASNSGLDYYQKIFAAILNYAKKEFLFAFEIGFDQKEAIEKMMQKQFSHYHYRFEQDYQHHWRFLFISSKAL